MKIETTVLEAIELLAIPLDQLSLSSSQWSEVMRSRFIESLLCGVPVPAMWVDARVPEAGLSALLDGRERVIAIKQFLGNGLFLEGLELLSSLESSSFIDLDASKRNTLLRVELPVNAITEANELEIQVLLKRVKDFKKLPAKSIPRCFRKV